MSGLIRRASLVAVMCGTGCAALSDRACAHVLAATSSTQDPIDVQSLLSTVLPMLIGAVLYVAGSIKVQRAPRELRWRATAFAAGLLVLAIALLSPLDRWAAELFSAHMVQHELLMLGAAPLLVLGRPLPLFLWAFPAAARPAIAGFFQRRTPRAVWTTLHGAGCAWLMHALALWVWHVPRFFNAALANRFVHDLQHLTFLVSALFFWSALFDARRAAQRGAGIVYLFTTTIHTGILGALITLASRPWYTESLQPLSHWPLSALEDQQLGGLIMWVPGSVVYVGAALVLFARWVAGSEPARARP